MNEDYFLPISINHPPNSRIHNSWPSKRWRHLPKSSFSMDPILEWWPADLCHIQVVPALYLFWKVWFVLRFLVKRLLSVGLFKFLLFLLFALSFLDDVLQSYFIVVNYSIVCNLYNFCLFAFILNLFLQKLNPFI